MRFVLITIFLGIGFPAFSQVRITFDSITNTESVYDSIYLLETRTYPNYIGYERHVIGYHLNGMKSYEYTTGKDHHPIDTAWQWTNMGQLEHIDIYTDTGYTAIDFWYDSGRISQMGQYTHSLDSNSSMIVRDSATFNIYESTPCWSDCYLRSGQWFTFYENGQLESEGKYLPYEFEVSYPLKDSAGIGVIVQKTSFDIDGYTMGIRCSTHLKDGTWKYYNEEGREISEEYYEGGLLKSVNEF